MFRIADGREHFYQWDLNRQIAVEDAAITQLHFCNKTDDCSLVVEVVDGLANVPNILLTTSWDIRVYGFTDEYTKVEKRFKVAARSKPTDYIYTETEVKNYEKYESRLATVESNCQTLGDTLSLVRTAVGQAITTANDALSKANTAQATATTAGGIAQHNKDTINYTILPKLTTLETTVGNIETAANTIIEIQKEFIGEITFTIKEIGGDAEYMALKGMTWQEWCNSSYRTNDRYSIGGDLVIYQPSASRTYAVGTKATNPVLVKATDKIADGGMYRSDLTLEGAVSDGD